MAFDATAHGTWGCPPEAYADVLRLLSAGDVVIHPFVDVAPMSSINDQLAAMAAHQLEKRMVLVPQPN
jgi:6-hydroxycyclohex-1-ene-1-carbonyl-CoA dehydrogenase